MGAIAIISAVSAAVSLGLTIYGYAKAKKMATEAPDVDSTTESGVSLSTQMNEGVVVPVAYGGVYLHGNIIMWKPDDHYEYDDWWYFGAYYLLSMGRVRTDTPWETSYRKHFVCYRQDQECFSIRYKHMMWVGTVDRGLNSETAPLSTVAEKYWYRKRMPDGSIAPRVLYFIIEETPLTQTYGRSCHALLDDGTRLIIPDGPGGGVGYTRTLDSTDPDYHPPAYYFPMGSLNDYLLQHWVPNTVGFLYYGPTDQSSASVPELEFYMEGILDTGIFDDGEGDDIWKDYGTDDTFMGLNPASIIYDMLTNVQYGATVPAADIDIDNFHTAGLYFRSLKYGLNFAMTQQKSVIDWIAQIQTWIGAFLVKNIDGKYQIRILQESDADSPVATVHDKDMISFTIRRKTWDDTVNAITAKYRQYGTNNMKALTLVNEANVLLTGSTRTKNVDMSAYTDLDVVSHRLTDLLRVESYPLASCTLVVNMAFANLTPGDVVTIDSDEYMIVAPFRVTEVNMAEIDKNQISFELDQMREIIV